MPAELISHHQNGPEFQSPTMPTQGSSTTSTTSRGQNKGEVDEDGGAKAPAAPAAPAAPPATAADNMTVTRQQQGELKHGAAHEHIRFIKRYRTEVAASASSVLSTLATFPLDSVKTRMQTYKYSGFVDCVRHTYQTEKFRGFFRGKSLGQLAPGGHFNSSGTLHFVETLRFLQHPRFQQC